MDDLALADACGRFAPSPSGPLHVGNLRTALLAWLFARGQAARFHVRIEDLDRARSRLEHVQGQLADLRRLGLDWDGVPMRQSERTAAYRAALELLRDRGLLYRCWCTRAEIRSAASAPHADASHAIYPGTCRRLSGAERALRAQRGRPAAWRVNAAARRVAFVDRLHGRVETPVDDFVVWREDEGDPDAGTPAYNLAVVVDDAGQGIGEVVRGDDLLATTGRQVLLANLLGVPAPRYAHVALVLGADGSRLAKRHGAVTLAACAARGESVEDLVGWMAWSAGLLDRPEPRRPSDLVEGFDPRRLRRAPTVWDGESGPERAGSSGAPGARVSRGRRGP